MPRSLQSILKDTALKTLRNRSGEGNVDWVAKKIVAASKNKKQVSAHPKVGRMYIYVYDAKHKKTLDYYDQLPLVIPIDPYSNGWLGINFHYLPIKERVFLMMKLLEFAKGEDEKQRLQLSYQLLKGVSKYKKVAPTIHRYLTGHIRSKIIEIPPSEYFDLLKLPLAHFTGASKVTVYKESKAQY